jgi:hypothetical protein
MGVMVGASVGISTTAVEADAIGIVKVGGGGGAPHKDGWQAAKDRILINRKLKRVTLWLRFFNLWV